MKTHKKLISLLLTLCLLFNITGNAFAASYTGNDVVPGLSGIQPGDELTHPDNTEWATLTAIWGVRVTFVDWDETELKSDTVAVSDTETGNSQAPQDPTRDGWMFTGWERVDQNGDTNVTLSDDGKVSNITGPGPIIYRATYVEDHGISGDPGSILIPFTKIWAGGSDAVRPDSITVKLYKYLGDSFNVSTATLVESKTLTEADDWKYTFDISNEALYSGTSYSSSTAYKWAVVEDDVAGYTEAAHTDPSVVFAPPEVAGIGSGWNRITPCSELNITTSGNDKSIVCAKKGNSAIVWTVDPLSQAEREMIQNSARSGISGAGGIHSFSFISGFGTSSAFGLTVTETQIQFSDSSAWSFFATGVYNKSSAQTNASSITNSPVFYVVHHAVHGDQDDTVDTIPMSAVDEDGYFDLTEPLTGENAEYYDGVREGYIYGGMYVGDHNRKEFEDEAETDLCGKELEPEAGMYYYMREVSEEFLQPRIVSVRRYWIDEHVERYLLTAVDKDGADNEFYTAYGFAYDVNAEDFDSYLSFGNTYTDETEEIYDESVDEEPYAEYDPMTCILYESIDVFKNGVLETTYKPGTVFSGRAGFEYITNDDYFGCVPYDESFADEGTMGEFAYNFHYTPFFVTADGVFVSGIYERYTDISKAATETAAVNLDFKLEDGSVTYSYSNAPVNGIALAFCFAANPDAVKEPMPEPTPAEPETDEVTLTVHANGETSVVTGEAGDFTEVMEAPEIEGYRFAGWYADAFYKTPMDFSDVEEDTDVYARLIDEAYFTVEMINTISKKVVTKSRIITVVDDRDLYQEVGLEITINGETTVYTLKKDYASVNGYSPVKIYGNSVDKHSRLIYQDIKLTGMADGTEIAIAPYYVTADGSRVYGKSRSVVYHVDHMENIGG